MANKIIHINPHVRTQNDRIDRVARSASASARVDGIVMSEGEIWKIASRVVKRYLSGGQ